MVQDDPRGEDPDRVASGPVRAIPGAGRSGLGPAGVRGRVAGPLPLNPPAWSSALNDRISARLSMAITVSIRRPPLSAPSTGAIRSRHFATTSSRVIGFAVVPRTSPTLSRSMVPSFSVTSTTDLRLGSSASSSASGTRRTLARCRSTAGSCIRGTSCAASKGLCQASCQKANLAGRSGTGSLWGSGAGAGDGLRGLRLYCCDRAARAYRPRLSPVPLP